MRKAYGCSYRFERGFSANERRGMDVLIRICRFELELVETLVRGVYWSRGRGMNDHAKLSDLTPDANNANKGTERGRCSHKAQSILFQKPGWDMFQCGECNKYVVSRVGGDVFEEVLATDNLLMAYRVTSPRWNANPPTHKFEIRETGGESRLHHMAKVQLCEWLTGQYPQAEIEIEKTVAPVNGKARVRRVDISTVIPSGWVYNQKTAYEIQLSRQTTEITEERTKDLLAAGYDNVVWVFGSDCLYTSEFRNVERWCRKNLPYYITLHPDISRADD